MNDVIKFLQTNNICYKADIAAKTISTYRGGGTIALGVYPNTVQELIALQQIISQNDIEYFIIGGGSNLLITDGVYNGLCIFTSFLTGLWIDGNNIFAGSGEYLPTIAKLAEQHELTGLEGLAYIPGTIGGAITMNAGAYGQEMAAIVSQISIFDFSDATTKTITADNIDWGYRSSGEITKNKIIISATLKLQPDALSLIKERTAFYKDLRKQKQPQAPSLGSVFKSVRGISAGYYIEKAGLKGCAVNGAQISDIHAGFIINTDNNGTTADYLSLMALAQTVVKSQFNIDLVPEVILLE